jgi:hypothetical protein
MLSSFEVEQRLARQERVQKAPVPPGPGTPGTAQADDWLASRFFDPAASPDTGQHIIRREVSRGPGARVPSGAAPDGEGEGMEPAERLRAIQERQIRGVITSALPGPQAWASLERPLPGGVLGHTAPEIVPQTGPARKAAEEGLTPQHSACQAAADAEAASDAERRRRRVRHEVDPYPAEDDAADGQDLNKRYRAAQAARAGYPSFSPVSPEEFRNGPLRRDHAGRGADYDAPRAVPVPSGTLSPAMLTRPLLTDGHSWPSPQGGC